MEVSFLERPTSDLQAQIYTSAHLLSFWTSSRHLKPFKNELKVFVPKTIPKICNYFSDTYDMAMKLCWLIDMTKINIHL